VDDEAAHDVLGDASRRRLRRFLPLLVVLAAALFGAGRAAMMRDVPGDFLRYHRAGRLVADGLAEKLYDQEFLEGRNAYAGERVADGDLDEKEFKYAPALAVAMAPLGALPARTANVLWSAWNAALMAGLFVVAWKWCGGGVRAWWLLVPLVVLLRVVTKNFNTGQVNPSAIVPAAVGLWAVSRGRDRLGGVLVGVGAAVKFMPALLVIWLAWKRRWAAAAFALAAGAAFLVLLPVAALGPSRALAANRAWIDARAHHFTGADSQDLPGYSAKSFVYRVLGHTPYKTKTGGREVNVVVGLDVLRPETLRILVLAIDLALLAWAFWLTRGPMRGGEDPRGPPEAALALAVLPLVSPEARYPHFLFAALALVALTCSLVREGPRRRGVLALFAVGCVMLNSTTDRLFGETMALAAEIYCLPGWGTLLLCFALALVLSRRRLNDAAPAAALRATGP
jgi:hypothetical protein